MFKKFLFAVLSGLVMLAAMACSSGSSSSQTSTDNKTAEEKPKQLSVAEITGYKQADRQKVLEEGAKKEGKIVLYTTALEKQSLRPLVDAFQKKYPFIKVEYWRGGGGDIMARVTQEYEAKQYNVDLIEVNTLNLAQFVKMGMLEKFYSPEMEAYNPTAVADYYVVDYASYVGMGYNTKLIAENEVPKTFDDLLNPKWAGKMVLTGETTGARWLGGMLEHKGEDFLRKLAESVRPDVQEASGRAVADLIIGGEYALSPSIYSSHVTLSAQTGAPINWSPLEGVLAHNAGMGIFKNSPHPYASMLFIDFDLSKEGQQVWIDSGYLTERKDLKVDTKWSLEGVKKVDLEAIYGAEVEKKYEDWYKIYDEIFRKNKK